MSQPPQYSPDGKFLWDGQQWVAVPAAPPPPKKKGHPFIYGCLGIITLLVVLGVCVAANTPKTEPTASTSTKASPSASTPSAATPAVVAKPTPTAPAKPQFLTFHDGQLRVPQDVQPGTYRTRTASPGCYFARLKGFSGQLSDVGANEIANGPSVVTVSPDDKGFQSRGCATWTNDLSALPADQKNGDGEFIVGTDWQPGTYRSSASGTCYWVRLRGWSHELGDVIANDIAQGPAVVTVSPEDVGFSTSGCGKWSAA